SYIEAVDNLSTTYKKSDSIVNDLQLTGNEIEQVTERIASLERQRINSFLTLTQRVVLIVVALLCTIGPLFVYKTAAYIVTPIKRLVNITKKISEGDITQRAPLKEQDETYELAMSFNTMLDNLYQTQQTCEIGKELLREKQSQLVEAERLATIGTVSSGIAHEINNPLHNIYLAAQVLSEQETSSNIVKEAVKDIYSETLRVKRIVNELLEFAREKTPELKNIYILDVINNALKMIKLPDTISNTKFNIEGPEDVYVFADGNQLEQVFINLFTNAMDAMEDSDGLLNIRINTADNNVQIKVSDTGTGISPQDIPMVFDPFFTTKDKGTGLGMAIVQCIVAKNKGKIEVDSEPNKGTTFTVTLPRGNHET
ncbi:MAG: HAMP domain-containing protein, partial [Thermodesulfovibrionia bacterium]|nr:HAMP domain-containing protein [Thermodesulfovibrionia bacterium]